VNALSKLLAIGALGFVAALSPRPSSAQELVCAQKTFDKATKKWKYQPVECPDAHPPHGKKKWNDEEWDTQGPPRYGPGYGCGASKYNPYAIGHPSPYTRYDYLNDPRYWHEEDLRYEQEKGRPYYNYDKYDYKYDDRYPTLPKGIYPPKKGVY
jgi:hypothetical protein